MLDFQPINFGIWRAAHGGREFIVQQPFAFDKGRHAQEKPAALIDGKWTDCESVAEAFDLCNAAT